jgi:cytochrome b561
MPRTAIGDSSLRTFGLGKLSQQIVCATRLHMPIQNPQDRYGNIAQTLHWVIAGLIVTQFVLASLADDLPLGLAKLTMYARHKSVGMTILMLAILRLIWRLINAPPALPAGMKGYEKFLAKATHGAMYALLFAMPLSGWLMSSAKNYSVSWFGLFTWPNLVAPNEERFHFFKDLHGFLATTLFVVAILHIAAALKHHFWNKDDVLRRMLPFARLGTRR